MRQGGTSLQSSAACRIKIQFIEFLCDKTGGAHIGEMAEDSQIPYRKTIKSKI